MIDTKDLRIGNKILFDSEIDTVSTIYKNVVDGEFKSRWAADRIHGILLSPSILEACGFENREALYLHTDSDHPLTSNSDGSFSMWLGSDESGDPFGFVRDVTHLHTLQNGWYFLTETELTIETTKI